MTFPTGRRHDLDFPLAGTAPGGASYRHYKKLGTLPASFVVDRWPGEGRA